LHRSEKDKPDKRRKRIIQRLITGPESFSVSKINQVASFFVVWIWVGFLSISFYKYAVLIGVDLKKSLTLVQPFDLKMVLLALIMAISDLKILAMILFFVLLILTLYLFHWVCKTDEVNDFYPAMRCRKTSIYVKSKTEKASQ
jgi:hypothetical protein